MNRTTFLFLALLCLSCGSDELIIPTGQYEVDPTFEPYVQEFIREGAQRGHNIDFSDTGLKIEFSQTAIEPAAGLCYLGRHHVVIDKVNWYRFSERFRTFLLFHELGHCELNRLHTNEQYLDGSWKSIMRGDPFVGVQNRIPVPYFGFRIEHYLDELFNPNIASPSWSNLKFDYVLDISKNNLFRFEGVDRVNEQISDNPSSYEIETIFELATAGNSRTKLEWIGNDLSYFIEIIPTWGYYLGVTLEGIDNFLFYDKNLTLHNGKPIEKITIRNHETFEQIFINDIFIYHIDGLTGINRFRIEAKDGNQINTDFKILSSTFDILD